MTSEALAAAARAHPGALYRVLRALASVGIFAKDESGFFRTTPIAELLRTDSPESLRAFVIMLGEPESWVAWGDVLHSVRTGKPAFEHAFGVPLFRYMAEHHDAAQIFDEAMTRRSATENAAVVAAYDLAEASTVVDVAGGQGSLLLEILVAFPHLCGVLFDVPHVVDGARRLLRGTDIGSRCRLHAGDFFVDALPAYADVYVLTKVIHDWNDQRAREILQACRRAMSGNARLLLIEPVVPRGNEPSIAKLLDLFMMVWPGGRERTEAEHQALLASAGLDMCRTIPTASALSIIEARPTPDSGLERR